MRTLVCVACLILGAPLSWAQDVGTQDNQGISPDQQLRLRDTLVRGLKARRQVEVDFLEGVAKLVEEDQTLPRDLTLAVYKWSKRKRKRFPFFYFQRAIVLKANEIGVDIPIPDGLFAAPGTEGTAQDFGADGASGLANPLIPTTSGGTTNAQ